MKNRFKLLTVLILFLSSGSVFAQYEESTYQPNFRIGAWFGPVAPFPGTALSDYLGTYLGGGIFVKMALPKMPFEAEAGISYNDYRSDTLEQLKTAPLYLALVYKIPIRLQLAINLKLGGGASYVRNFPEMHENILPLGYAGFDISFAAGRRVRVGLRIDYNLLYEQHLSPPAGSPAGYTVYNGHMINIGLMLSFKVKPE